jgi:hypothetical protein
MDFDQGREILTQRGLNIFAAVSVADLPEDLRFFAPGKKLDQWTLCVLASGGGRLWESLPHPLNRDEHPVDAFSIAQIQWFAREVLRDESFELLFPRDDLLLPLQRIGRFLNLARPSLLGLDINPDYGVWFAYRGVFLTSASIPRNMEAPFVSACETCATQPCRTACPPFAVGLLSGDFNLKTCASYRLSENSCCADRCLARLACPVHAEQRYSLAQIQYHMARSAHLRRLTEFKS